MNNSGESSASSVYRSHENIRSIFSGPFSSSEESAFSPTSDCQQLNLSRDSVVESFEELSTGDVFNNESGRDKSGRHVLLTSDFQQMVKNAERTCARTPSYRKVADLLREHRSATISGSMKDGKTTMALSLSHEYLQEGWNIFYHDFSSATFGCLSDSETGKSLYVFENIFSSPKVQYELEKIMEKKNKNKESAFLFTCLSFNLKGTSIKLNSDMFSEDQIVNVAFEMKNCNFVKWKILRKHPTRLSTEQVSQIAQQSPTHTGFPGLCKLFSDSSVGDPIRFFTYPHEHYQALLTSLFKDKKKCCVFIILVLSGGQFYLGDMIEMNESAKSMNKLLQQLFPEIRMETLVDELPLLYGLFLKESYHIVSFQHDVIYDAAVFVLDNMYPGFLWKHCKVEHVEDGDIGWTNSGERNILYLTGSNNIHFINYLVKNFKRMQLKAILQHPALHNNRDNVDLFIDKLERSYEDFITYEDPSGGNFLFWCMKSSCVHMQGKILNHWLLANGDILDCLTFDLTQEVHKLPVSSVDSVLTKLKMNFESCNTMQDVMFTAVSVGDVERVTNCVQHGANLTLLNKAGETCLHLASLHGQLSVVLALIDTFKVTSFNSQDMKGLTPAMVAQERGYSEIASVLIAKGADLSVRNNDGNALIHLSCLSGNVDTTRFLLLSKKQDANLLGQDERTPVMMAALTGELETVMLLEEYGCDMSARDVNGDNILHMSCLGSCLKVVEYVVDSGKVNINSTNKLGRSCLMIASVLGNKTLFDNLLSKGCDPTLVDVNGNTALHYALLCKDVEYIQFLLSKKLFDVNAQGEQGRSSMMMAVTSGLTEVIDFLLPLNIKWNICDKTGNNALHEACRSQRFGIVQKIVDLSVLDIDCRGSNKMTPAMLAALAGNIRMLDTLIKAGADVSLRDGDGNSILHLASREGQTEMVFHIMNMKLMDINMKGLRSRSPLMMAILRGHTATVDTLLSESDLSDVDEDGYSPLVLACMSDSDNEVIVDMLIKDISDASGQSRPLSLLVDRSTDTHTLDNESRQMSLESVTSVESDSIHTVTECDQWNAQRMHNGWTPVMYAAKVNNLKIVRYLCRTFDTFDLFKRNISGDNVLHVACLSDSLAVAEFLSTEFPELVDTKGNAKKTPLMIAVMKKNLRLFNYLLTAGANPRLNDASKHNVLHIAASVGSVQLATLIVKNNLCDIESRGQLGRTAFMIAARKENDDVCDALKWLGCNIFCVDDNGNSILHVSKSEHVLQKVQRMFNIDTRNKLGQTPAMRAARRGHFKTFKCLFDLGSNVNIMSTNGRTVLHEASIGGNVEIVKLLIAQDDVDVNATEASGKTPVMFAAEKGHKGVFFALVFAGCDLWRKNHSGMTCYRFALKGGNKDIIKYIEKSKDIT